MKDDDAVVSWQVPMVLHFEMSLRGLAQQISGDQLPAACRHPRLSGHWRKVQGNLGASHVASEDKAARVRWASPPLPARVLGNNHSLVEAVALVVEGARPGCVVDGRVEALDPALAGELLLLEPTGQVFGMSWPLGQL